MEKYFKSYNPSVMDELYKEAVENDQPLKKWDLLLISWKHGKRSITMEKDTK